MVSESADPTRAATKQRREWAPAFWLNWNPNAKARLAPGFFVSPDLRLSGVSRIGCGQRCCRTSKSGGCYHRQVDRSNGYEGVAEEFLARRGHSNARATAIGVKEVRRWARSLPRGSSVIDLGCGPGFPITVVLVEEGLHVFGVDASPSFVAAFQRNLPGTPILCEGVLESGLFDRTFDAVLAWGLMFLLQSEDQHRLIQRFAEILVPGGRLLFTSPAKPVVWNDGMTGVESVSLGAERYRGLLRAAGISVSEEYEDVGENHYFDAFKGK